MSPATDVKTEEWRPVEGWPYEVSSLGRVRRSKDGHCTRAGRIRKLRPTSRGYPGLDLYRDGGEVRYVAVHTLVAHAFLGPPRTGHQVNHKNGDKTDNRPANLEWVTSQENVAHATRTGLVPRGEGHGRSKLTASMVREIRREYQPRKVTQPMLAKRFDVSKHTIEAVVLRKVWRHV